MDEDGWGGMPRLGVGGDANGRTRHQDTGRESSGVGRRIIKVSGEMHREVGRRIDKVSGEMHRGVGRRIVKVSGERHRDFGRDASGVRESGARGTLYKS